ncbi:hypothetical protein BD324DRAFT_284732 [Kockovaella imperatae]|uniref:Uncharacterized protein n=1 Tax=Kockovaella imperatae TaxID=4999 RepID=A0A1Y1U5Q9_9TREE|nr:hypothetical protein BD324DRAFT_284732 [Kockovaella imperatae]ORX33371.1 hypothetical protein BD324DRAFT_284732 [Kockovaella imperatae]
MNIAAMFYGYNEDYCRALYPLLTPRYDTTWAKLYPRLVSTCITALPLLCRFTDYTEPSVTISDDSAICKDYVHIPMDVLAGSYHVASNPLIAVLIRMRVLFNSIRSLNLQDQSLRLAQTLLGYWSEEEDVEIEEDEDYPTVPCIYWDTTDGLHRAAFALALYHNFVRSFVYPGSLPSSLEQVAWSIMKRTQRLRKTLKDQGWSHGSVHDMDNVVKLQSGVRIPGDWFECKDQGGGTKPYQASSFAVASSVAYRCPSDPGKYLRLPIHSPHHQRDSGSDRQFVA